MRKTLEREGTQPISGDQLNYEHSEDSPAEVEELLVPADVGEAEASRIDEKREVSDEQSTDDRSKCVDPVTTMIPTSGLASTPDGYTPGPAAMGESTALSMMSASQVNHSISPPAPPVSVFPTHDAPMPYSYHYMPAPPLVVYIPYPPYQMTLYPIYPVYFPPPTI
jgi:hypothetical protein